MLQQMNDNADTVPGDGFNGDNNHDIIEKEPNLEENSIMNQMEENGTNNSQDLEEGKYTSDYESDDVNIVIGDVESTPAQHSSLNIKCGGLLTLPSTAQEKLKPLQPGKFSIDEFETNGTINGIPAQEYNLDQMEDKPWRQPGADITDYFNYGFNEESWGTYCEKQKRMRNESGVGSISNASGPNGPGNMANPGSKVPQVAITNYNSRYAGIVGPKNPHRVVKWQELLMLLALLV